MIAPPRPASRALRLAILIALGFAPLTALAQQQPFRIGKGSGFGGASDYMQSPSPGECVSLNTLSASDCRMVTRGGCYNCSSTNLGTAADDLVLFPPGFQGIVYNRSATGADVRLCFSQTASIALSAYTGVEGGYSTWDSSNSSSGPPKCIDVPAGIPTFFKVSAGEWGPCAGDAGSRRPVGCRARGCTAVAAVAGPDPVVGSGCLSNAECGTGTCGNEPPRGLHAGVCTDTDTDQVITICRAGQ